MTVNLERDFSADAAMGIEIHARGPLDPFGRLPTRYRISLVDGSNEEEMRVILNEGQVRILVARLSDFLR